MNVDMVRQYMINANREKFNGIIDFSKVSFLPSSDNGIIVDLNNGHHKLRIGAHLNNHQINRAIILILIDTVMKVKNEEERETLGECSYTEYGGKVSQLQSKYFPHDDVFIETDGKIIRDSILDCDLTLCRLQKSGQVEKDKILGLNYKEVKLLK